MLRSWVSCAHVHCQPSLTDDPWAEQVCLNILRAGLIASRVDLSVQKYPGVIAAPLVIGTIAGSGGKFLQDGIQMACGSLHGDYLEHITRQNVLGT